MSSDRKKSGYERGYDTIPSWEQTPETPDVDSGDGNNVIKPYEPDPGIRNRLPRVEPIKPVSKRRIEFHKKPVVRY